MNDKKIKIGIDVGIASVGWALLDENNEIVLHGVRLFDTVDSPRTYKLLSQDRRSNRAMRRKLSRIKTRKRDAIKLFIENNLYKPNNFIDSVEYWKNNNLIPEFSQYLSLKNGEKFNIYSCRKKMLYEKEDSIKYFLRGIYWYLTNRGWNYDENLNEEKNKKSKKDENNSSSKKSEIDENEKIKIKTLNDILVTNDYIVEKQLKLWNPNKHSTTKVKGVINNYFKREDYRKELEIILKKQSHFADEIFRENFLKIFDRQREFQLGPGGPKSPTEYGLWQEVNGKIEKKDENLWEKNIRKCLIYQNENVAPKKSFSNYLFSVLCYLNNLTCNNEKLSYESKNRLLHENFDFVKIKFSNISNNRILKKFKQQLDNEELKIDDIYGFATELKSSKNNKEKLAIPKKFPYTNELLKEIYLKILNSEFKLKSTFAKENDFFSRNQKLIDLIDLIIIFLSKFVTKKIRLNNFQNETEIHNLFGELFDSSNFKKSLRKFSEEIKGIQNISGTASLSLKGLKKELKHLLENDWNHNQYLKYSGVAFEIEKRKREIFEKNTLIKNTKHLTGDWINKMIISPSVKRGVKQTINVLNAIFDYCKKNNYKIETITLEMPKERNNIDVKKRKSNHLKKISDEWNEVITEFGLKNKGSISRNKILKMKLWIEQNGCDVYDGNEIKKEDFISNMNDYEIDHIIPFSISFDNSMENKVLTKKKITEKKVMDFPKKPFLKMILINYLKLMVYEINYIKIKILKNYLFLNQILMNLNLYKKILLLVI